MVYWKLYSQRLVRKGTTRSLFNRFIDRGVGAGTLNQAMIAYLADPTRGSFVALRDLFGFRTSVIAFVAPFSALQNPTAHSMVDTRIAKWVNTCRERHNGADPNGPQLSNFLLTGTALTMAAFDAFQDWRRWCVNTLGKLSARTR